MPLQRGVSQVERSDIVTALTNGFVKVPTLPEFCCTGVIVAFCLVFHLSFLRVQAKLSLPACPEFDVPADLHEALLNGTILPNTSFAPAAYSAIRRSVYMHSQPREMQLARDQETCSCIASAGFCDERCQNRALQQLIMTGSKGWGVKTTSNLRKGQLVVEYVGEVIDRESWE
ncbi:MAG: hypothetical protein SGPRY_009822, partial [Prymnesium sp.]